MSSDVASYVTLEGRRPARIAARRPPAASDEPPQAASEVTDETPDVPMPPSEAYLGRIVVQRPSLAAELLSSLGLNVAQLTHPALPRLIETASHSDSDLFPVHLLSPADQRLAGRLLVDEVPELDPDGGDPAALRRAMTDCVNGVREASVNRSIEVVRHELRRARDEGREADFDALAARLTELAAEKQVLRGSLSVH